MGRVYFLAQMGLLLPSVHFLSGISVLPGCGGWGVVGEGRGFSGSQQQNLPTRVLLCTVALVWISPAHSEDGQLQDWPPGLREGGAPAAG